MQNMSQVCTHCDCDPCLWEEFKVDIIGEEQGKTFMMIDQSLPPNEICKQAYRAFVHTWKGYQGKGRCVRIPHCVLTGIRNIWPDPNGCYMGHYDSNKMNNDNDAGKYDSKKNNIS
jgi:hypothetical protein